MKRRRGSAGSACRADVCGRPVHGQPRAHHRRRLGAGADDGRHAAGAWRGSRDLGPAHSGAGGGGGRHERDPSRPGRIPHRGHPRRRGGRRGRAGQLRRGQAADRADQQRRRQLHQPHRGSVTPRLPGDLRHRFPRHVQRDPGGGAALDCGGRTRCGGQHRRHLGVDRSALRAAIGHVQGGDRRDDEVAGGGMGPLWHQAELHRPRAHPH